MEMPKPGPAHQQLAKLAGQWSGSETMHPAPWDPEGGSATGTVTNRVALDGFTVIQDYERVRDGKVTFRGHGVFSVDQGTGQPTLHWWDSLDGAASFFTGSWRGDTLVMSNQSPMGHLRCAFGIAGARYTFAIEFSQDGETWTPVMTGSYAK
ncbi:MAG: DUF1579 family protein [Planctomycetes bacterium]|nr:DUF1579 family protein [Planctomycetota bacterium]